jgi:hypothetical protein
MRMTYKRDFSAALVWLSFFAALLFIICFAFLL